MLFHQATGAETYYNMNQFADMVLGYGFKDYSVGSWVSSFRSNHVYIFLSIYSMTTWDMFLLLLLPLGEHILFSVKYSISKEFFAGHYMHNFLTILSSTGTFSVFVAIYVSKNFPFITAGPVLFHSVYAKVWFSASCSATSFPGCSLDSSAKSS